MEQILPHLWVGDDADYESVKDRKSWRFVRCCKYGPGGHQQTLGYHTLAAPEGKDHFWVRRGHLLALNMLDLDDPNFIDQDMIDLAINTINKWRFDGDTVLVSCNHGHSRSPSMTLMYLRSVGEMPYNFLVAERIFRGIYPPYDPAQGIRQYARMHW